MTNLQKDQKAADLYLEHWQLSEKPNNPNDKKYIGDDEARKDWDRQKEITKELKDLGYPNPNDIVYDNDSVPFVKWKSKNFSCEDYYDAKWSAADSDE